MSRRAHSFWPLTNLYRIFLILDIYDSVRGGWKKQAWGLRMAIAVDVLDEFVEAAQSVIGDVVTIERSATTQYNEEASRDSIRHYAWGTTDLNPLWLSDDYARRARFGTIVAPPTFAYSIILPTLPVYNIPFRKKIDFAVVYGGTSWEFFKPIVLGDSLHATGRLVGAEIKTSKTVGRMVMVTPETLYYNGRSELVARGVARQLRFLPQQGNAAKTSELQGRETKEAAQVEMSPEALAEQAVRRGTEPLYWEDVRNGESLPDVKKGALRMTDIIRWNAGTYGPPFLSTRVTSSGELMGAGHYDAEIAQSVGIPGAYDNGPLRAGWLSQLVTNWMGDWGDLVRLEYSLRLFNVVGDVNTVKGRVTGKRRTATEAFVDVELAVENHRGLRSAEGSATVRLPTRRGE
jgi:acyl dehydratase